jgi:hypothetical protein
MTLTPHGLVWLASARPCSVFCSTTSGTVERDVLGLQRTDWG